MKTLEGNEFSSSAQRQVDQLRANTVDDEETLFGLAGALLATLWRWRLLILAMVACGLIAAWLVLQTIPSTFVARTEVYFDFSRQSFVSDLPDTAVAPSEAMLNTEMEILVSRRLMEVVVDELGLLDDPEFNPWLAAPGEPADASGWTPPDEDARRTAVSILLGKVSVSLVPASYVFSITVETLAPEKSAAIANGIANLFIQERSARRLKASEDAIAWLEDRTVTLRDRVREAEDQVAQQRALASPGADSFLASTAVQIASLRERLATIQAEALRLANLQADLGAASERGAIDAETASALREFSGDLAQDIEDVSATDGERFDELISRARTLVARGAERASNDEVRVQIELAGLLEVYADRTDEAQALRDVEREATASLAAYEAVLERLKNRVAVGALDPFFSEATIISPAVPPAYPASPERELILALGGVGSFALASGLALVLNALFPVISSARVLERVTGIPVLAQIPLPAHGRLSSLQQAIRRRGNSRLAASIRTLRIAIALGSRQPAPRVLMLTSAESIDGTRAVGYLLAESFVQTGQKALLIDADPAPGDRSDPDPSGSALNSVLLGEIDPKEAITVDPSTGLPVLLAPQDAGSEMDLLAFSGERGGFDRISSGYDLIVVIAPSVDTLPDAQIFARLSDAVLLVVQKHASRPTSVSDALDLLIRGGASRVGTVLLSRRGR